MTPQHTGATADDLTTWDTADYETNQNLAAVHSPTARPGQPQPSQTADTHLLAA